MKIPFLKEKEEELPSEIPEERIVTLKDIIAPSSITINYNSTKIGERLARTFFVFSYPRYLTTGWFSPVVNLGARMDISIFIHPEDTAETLKKLRRKVTEVQAEISEREEKGLTRDPALEAAYRNLENLRDRLQTAQERMARLGVYITIYGEDQNSLDQVETNLRSILESRLIYIKPALYQQKQGFVSTSPYGLDQLGVHTPMNTNPLSTIFPFISFDLSSNEGILYGINRHNNSLVLFDRFTLENANEVIFGKAGSGKSYAIKLEILRSLMQGIGTIVIDPENEYRSLADSVEGSFIDISLGSENHINPFDLPLPRKGEDPKDVLRSNIINLVGLLRIMLGGLTPEEDSLVDQALTQTYAAKDITPQTDPQDWSKRTPVMEDLETVLESMEGTESVLRRLRKYTRGTYEGFANRPTNVSVDKPLVVFGIRDMEEELRPMAMFIIMRFIWNMVRTISQRRILVVDEAWWIMKTEDGASFLYGLAKRGRKYSLGVTTITQDVNDFMKSEYGQPIITNSSLQLLMKQSPATIDVVRETFNLSEEEKYLLLEAEVGEGLFFAGQKHVAIKVMASYLEDQIIVSTPQEISKIEELRKRK